MGMRSIAVLAVMTTLLAVRAASAQVPDNQEGWIPPPAKLVSDEWSTWRDEDPERFLRVHADFDGDGEIDTAELLVSDRSDKYALFVVMSSSGRPGPIYKIDEVDDSRMVARLGLSTVRPGTYWTVCKEIIDCDPDEVTLRFEGIKFFLFDGAEGYFFWDPDIRAFQFAGITD